MAFCCAALWSLMAHSVIALLCSKQSLLGVKRTSPPGVGNDATDPKRTFDDELGGAESLPGYSRTVGRDRSGGETRAVFASNQNGIVWQYQSGVGGLAP